MIKNLAHGNYMEFLVPVGKLLVGKSDGMTLPVSTRFVDSLYNPFVGRSNLLFM